VVPDLEIADRIHRDRVAESALDGAMGWDEIDPVDHMTYFNFDSVLQKLSDTHTERFNAVQEYQLQKKEMALLENAGTGPMSASTPKTPENLEQFRNKQLALVNERRELQDKKIFDSWQAYQKDAESPCCHGAA